LSSLRRWPEASVRVLLRAILEQVVSTLWSSALREPTLKGVDVFRVPVAYAGVQLNAPTAREAGSSTGTTTLAE
jgi:hypothetical protein